MDRAILPEEQRREIFRALVEAQDQEMSVTESRRVIAEQFGINSSELSQIERQGMDHDWPPL